MAKIDEMPDYRAQLPSSTHDLSHDFGFTCTCAHLLPVFHDYLNAGETIKLGFNYFLRTQPLQSAAMSKLNTHVEYFFVPMQLLYQPFGSFLYGIQDEFSSYFVDPILDSLPVVNLDDIYDNLNTSNRNLYTQNGVAVGENERTLVYRLADMLGFDPTRMILGSVPAEHINPNVFPYQYLAYNCIYQYYYRLDSREKFSNTDFNFDQYYRSASALGYGDIDRVEHIFTLKYRPLGNDYFTDCKISPIVDVLNLSNKSALQSAQDWLASNTNVSAGALSGISGIYSTFQQALGSSGGSTGAASYHSPDDFQYSTQVFTQDQVHGNIKTAVSNGGALEVEDSVGDTFYSSVRTPHTHSIPVSSQSINTANLRAMFASEKLWSITGRAKKHYDDQTLAHFGFKVPHDPKHQITCFGHDKGSINIGEVISTSNTYDSQSGSGSPLAEIAGKGYGSLQGQEHTFKAPCHGVVMVIFSVICDRNYFQGVPKYNVMTGRSDLYQPEYDHLGMQPIFGYEVGDYVLADHSSIFGWQYRYEQWKRRYNRVTTAFCSRSANYSAPFASWLNLSYQNITDSFDTANANSFVNFVNLPTDINELMLLPYNLTWSGSGNPYVTDPFIVASHITAKKISTMSDYSLPRLDA